MARPSARHNKGNKPTNKNSTVKVSKTPKQSRRRKAASDDDESESEAYVDEDSDVGSILSIDSDAIDESDFETAAKGGKRKRASIQNGSPKKVKPAAKKPRNSKSKKEDEEFDDLEDGQEVVGTVVEAPKTGRGIFIHNMTFREKQALTSLVGLLRIVPPGQISQNTLNFLKQLQDPECNDRTWYYVQRMLINTLNTHMDHQVQASR